MSFRSETDKIRTLLLLFVQACLYTDHCPPNAGRPRQKCVPVLSMAIAAIDYSFCGTQGTYKGGVPKSEFFFKNIALMVADYNFFV